MNEKIKGYASTVTAVFSALVVLYGVFKFIETGKQNAESNKEIKANQQKIILKIDSLGFVVNDVKTIVLGTNEKTNEVIKSQNSLRNSYVKLVKTTVKDRDFFLELLNGIQWVVSPIEDKRTDSVDFKILIKKK